MGLILFILIAIVAEIVTWIVVGDWVGSGWYVFFWFIAAFFIGLNMIRGSTSHIMPQMQQMQMTGQMSSDPQVSKYMTRAIAGFLLMIPGLLTDVVALLMLIPAVQNVFKKAAIDAMQKRQQAMMEKMMGGMGGMSGASGQGNPFADIMRQMEEMQRGQMGGRGASNDANIIDGEAREVEPEQKRIETKDKE
ncbi:FxsA family protein [Acinetobacter populi]|uniref:FxsA protein n=1 Tax=Acinetobacter populi TaxID=1582270 RepID=A0A1Z9YXM5_9GAMM|nr:FxsA family protein [Acinetobacter populi]OUY06948.1 FxsA protein [Acinetobacter populi]